VLGFDINGAYRDAVEEDQFERAAALREAIGVLTEGISPICFADDAAGQMEAGLRRCKDAAMAIAVNHLPEANSATLRINDLDFEPIWACDLTTFEPVEIEADGSGCTTSVSLPGRHAQAIALFPAAPAGLDLAVLQDDLSPGARLSYRVRMLDDDGRQARGCHLLEIDVTGPNGGTVTRFGGSTASEGGEMRRAIAIPVNAVPGEYRIHVTAPQASQTAEATFTVSG
jgi:hypothetical protein